MEKVKINRSIHMKQEQLSFLFKSRDEKDNRSDNVILFEFRRQQKNDLEQEQEMERILQKFLKHEETLDW